MLAKQFSFILLIIFNCFSIAVYSSCDVDLLSSASTKNMTKFWSSSWKNVQFILASCDAVIGCLDSPSISVAASDNPVWLDDDGREVFGTRFEVLLSSGGLKIGSVQPEDSSRYVCRYGNRNNSTKPYTYIDHYLIVFSLPTISIDYTLQYEVSVCDWERQQQKLQQMGEMLSNKRITRPNGFFCSVSSSECGLEPAATNMRFKVVLSCRLPRTIETEVSMELACPDAECVSSRLTSTIYNATKGNANRWKAAQHTPENYKALFDPKIPFPEFRLNLNKLRNSSSATCGFGYESIANVVCLPCKPGYHYDRLTRLCIECEKNFFSNMFAMGSCDACPLNGTTSEPRATRVEQCVVVDAAMVFVHKRWIGVLVIIIICLLINLIYILFTRRRLLHLAGSKKATVQRKPARRYGGLSKDKTGEGQQMLADEGGQKDKMLVMSPMEFLTKFNKNTEKDVLDKEKSNGKEVTNV